MNDGLEKGIIKAGDDNLFRSFSFVQSIAYLLMRKSEFLIR